MRRMLEGRFPSHQDSRTHREYKKVGRKKEWRAKGRERERKGRKQERERRERESERERGRDRERARKRERERDIETESERVGDAPSFRPRAIRDVFGVGSPARNQPQHTKPIAGTRLHPTTAKLPSMQSDAYGPQG